MSQALLVCKHVELARSLCSVLRRLQLFDEIYTVRSGREANAKPREARLDIALLAEGAFSETMPEYVSAFKVNHPGTKVLALTRTSSKESLVETYFAGANGVLPIGVNAQVLELSIHALMRGLTILDKNGVSAFTARNIHSSSADTRLGKDDLEILKLVSEGLSNKSIAKQIYYSENTVKFRISSLMTRFDVTTRVELAVNAVRKNLI